MSDPLHDKLLPLLEQVRRVGKGYTALCPAHEDHDPSLSIEPGRDQPILLKCQSQQCPAEDIVAAVGLTMADLCAPREETKQRPAAVAEYPYHDESGVLLYKVKRWEPGWEGKSKSFAQYRPDGTRGIQGIRRVLYRLPDLLAAVQAGRRVWVVEGEKDVDRLVRMGEVATCNSGGTGSPWPQPFAEWFRGADVVIVADNDDAGVKHAERTAELLGPVTKSLVVMRPAVDHPKADISDHLNAGHALDELRPLNASGEVARDAKQADGVAEEPTPTRRVKSQPLRQIKRRRRKYLWDQRLPLGELTLWVGHAGIGKSQGAVWLAAQVSRGQLDGELKGSPAPVLYLGTEDSWEYTLAPRFDAADADPDMVYRLYVETSPEHEDVVTLAVDLETLREEIVTTGARLVVLDALLSTFGGAKLTEQGVVRRNLEPLARLAQELGIAIVGVAHFRKSSDSNPLHMISGSSEFGQVVRSAIGFAEDRESEDGSCILSLIKTNIAARNLPSLRYRVEPYSVQTSEGPSDVGRFVLLGETDQSINDVLNREHTSAEERSEVEEATEWLKEFLLEKRGEVARSEVMKQAKKEGFSEATVKRAKAKAKVAHKSLGFPKTSFWIHPEFVTDGDIPVGSRGGELTGGELTEPTGTTSGNTVDDSQSAQGRVREPTGVASDDHPKGAATQGELGGAQTCSGCGWSQNSHAHAANCGDAA